MRLLFQRPTPDGHWIDEIIAHVCGPYCHAELQFDDGRMFSSTFKTGVRILSTEEAVQTLAEENGFWDAVELPWASASELTQRCERMVGLGYDAVGAVSSGFGWARQNPNKWFCSEVCADALNFLKSLGIPTLINPTSLKTWIEGYLDGEEPSFLNDYVTVQCVHAASKFDAYAMPHHDKFLELMQDNLRGVA